MCTFTPSRIDCDQMNVVYLEMQKSFYDRDVFHGLDLKVLMSKVLMLIQEMQKVFMIGMCYKEEEIEEFLCQKFFQPL